MALFFDVLSFLVREIRDSPFFFGIAFNGVGEPAKAPRKAALSRDC